MGCISNAPANGGSQKASPKIRGNSTSPLPTLRPLHSHMRCAAMERQEEVSWSMNAVRVDINCRTR